MMYLHPILAFIDMPILLGIGVLAALLFGADKLPKLARSAGQAKKEFMLGQMEAEDVAAKARDDARKHQEADATASAAAAPPTTPPHDERTP